MIVFVKQYPINCKFKYEEEVMEYIPLFVDDEGMPLISPSYGYAICYESKKGTSPNDYLITQKEKTIINEYGEEQTFAYYEATLKTQ